MMSEPLVLSLGSINADFSFPVERAARSGGTVVAGELLRTSGGKAANRAVQACRLGVPARLFGCVGDDDLASQARTGPASAGVDIAGVGVAPGPTGVAAILVEPSGEKSITLAPGANDSWPAEHAAGVAEALAAAPSEAVVAADLEATPGALREVLRLTADRGLVVVLDPSPPDRMPAEMWSAVDHVTPNADEARRLTGVEVTSLESAAEAGAELVARGAHVAYVKLGSGGCVVVDADGAVAYEVPDVPVVDATGAGDGFAGALGAGLARGWPPVECAVVAVSASACSVGRRGSQESYAGRDEVERMARRVRPSTLAGAHGM